MNTIPLFPRMPFILFLLMFPLVLGAGQKNYVIIKKGDNLWRISKKYNVPLPTLYAINHLTPSTKIKVGMRIILFETKKETAIFLKLNKPVEGVIYNQFNQGKNLVQKNGVEFKTDKSAPVKSASDGIVKYTGGLRGYGNVVIVEYSTNISLIYAFLDRVLVRTDEKVKKSQLIGTVGRNNFCDLNILHFELLHNGMAINPIKYFN